MKNIKQLSDIHGGHTAILSLIGCAAGITTAHFTQEDLDFEDYTTACMIGSMTALSPSSYITTTKTIQYAFDALWGLTIERGMHHLQESFSHRLVHRNHADAYASLK